MILFFFAISLTVLISLIFQIDDLMLDLFSLVQKIKPTLLNKQELQKIRLAPQRKLAVLIPSWREAETLAQMVRGNFSRLEYQNFSLFLGVYPNDQATWKAARELEKEFPHLSILLNPQPGPSSKAELLNEMLRQILEFEKLTGIAHEAFLFHDADDIIHPYSFSLINFELERSPLVQLPLFSTTPSWNSFTQGIYADESAESQNRDLLTRATIGATIPMNGTGLAVGRAIVNSLVAIDGKLFGESEAAEGYHLGLRLNQMGFRPKFISAYQRLGRKKDFIATRRVFPGDRNAAIVHRARKIAGITWQGANKFGWNGNLLDRYFFWRDRRSTLSTVVRTFASGLALLSLFLTFGATPVLPSWLEFLSLANAILWVRRILWRMKLSASVHGWGFACFAPLRWPFGNFLNSLSNWRAMVIYRKAKKTGQAPQWQERKIFLPKNFGESRSLLRRGTEFF